MATTTTSVTPIFTQGQKDIFGTAEGELIGAQQGLPNIATLGTNVPGMDVPGLDPTQLQFLSSLEGNAMNNPDMAAARSQLQALTSGPLGSSPETVAGMKAYEDLVAPQIATDSALRGTAGGGQGLEALAMGETQAAVPLIQQEISNRQQAVGQYAGLGNQQQQAIAQALEASGLPREVALQQAEAIWQQQQQQWQTQLGIQEQAVGWIPMQTGQHTVNKVHQGPWDIVGAVGKGLQGPAANMLSGGKGE